MASIGNKRTRCLAWLAAFTGIVLSLSGCHFSEEELWASCCRSSIIKDRSATSEGPRTIIAWQRETRFSGNGEATDFVPLGSRVRESWKKQRIQSDLVAFLAGKPERPATDYFLGLGMSCMTRAVSSKDAKSHCEIELPIWIECDTAGILLGWGPSVPKELRQPIPAHLRMSIDVSVDAVLDVSTRIDPVPGGHLCHR